MECAGRGLAFWSYQTTQEMSRCHIVTLALWLIVFRMYNEAMGKNLADKYSHLSGQLDKIVHDANGEIQSLQNKIKSIWNGILALPKYGH
jgi:E3 ubiquitin-protein ligase CCNP1IP1